MVIRMNHFKAQKRQRKLNRRPHTLEEKGRKKRTDTHSTRSDRIVKHACTSDSISLITQHSSMPDTNRSPANFSSANAAAESHSKHPLSSI
mmetsp:Transcript_19731/g.32379  ORF Transcript_19731/g.32379 Transcript_19731/m.32379 type:complete len:91 (+) Transcript_19731:182-454(+)